MEIWKKMWVGVFSEHSVVDTETSRPITTTMTEVLGRQYGHSSTSSFSRWLTPACRKTKKLLIGPVLKDSPPSFSLSGTPVERVTAFKLLGVYCTSRVTLVVTTCRRHHDEAGASQLHFLKQLKRSGAGREICSCASMAQWSVRCWSTPARSGTQVSLSRSRKHWSRCIIYEDGEYTRCHWFQLDLTRLNRGVNNEALL